MAFYFEIIIGSQELAEQYIGCRMCLSLFLPVVIACVTTAQHRGRETATGTVGFIQIALD